jgi:thiamine-phosphate pyrophosphorylase
MTNLSKEEKSLLFRGIDANLNRLKEGLRVLEDICRFSDKKEVASQFKELRHLATLPNYKTYLQFRDIENDVLKESLKIENRRVGISDLILANFKRVQESSRVLEEFFKLENLETSEIFKKIRYKAYSLEKKSLIEDSLDST